VGRTPAPESDPLRQLERARRMSHGEQLARAARKHGQRIAFRFRGEERSFAELDARATRVANALRERGVGAGQRVALLLPNRLETVEAIFGTLRLGAICVPLNTRLLADEVAALLADCGATALVADESLAEPAGKARAQLPALSACLLVGDPRGCAALGPGAAPFEEALAAAASAPPAVDVADHDPAFLLYTSGTTGRPKGALLSHFNLVMNTFHGMIEQRICGEDEVWLAGLPLFHVGGLNGILPYVMTGGTSILWPTGHFDAAQAVDEMERSRVTGCFFVATQWQQICALPGVRERDFALRRIAWGASTALPSVLRAMAETFPGVPLYTFFGQTEMSSVTAVLRGEDAVRKLGSVGRPCLNVEARIVDDEMRDVAPGEVGEIVYRGPTVCQGYWGAPEATAEAFAGGWFHSGDLVRQDEEGFLWVVDRKKDVIISGGENIYSAEVEAVIEGHPEVAEVAVVGIPHPRWMETPCAVVVPRDARRPPPAEAILELCRARLASFKKPTAVVYTDALPRNASGKVLKTRLREQYRALGGSDE
jgi:acyl-CoA synthetase (AMP-forming)/AMP-acid ligase II